MKLEKITRREIEALHTSLQAKPHTANRILELLSAMFNYSIKEGVLKESPLFKIKKFTEERRERFLSNDEVRRLLEFLQKK